jgi:hypothetical protein
MFTVFADLLARDPRWAAIRPRVLQIHLSDQQRSACSLNVPSGGVQGILAIPAMSRLCSWGMISLRCESIYPV